MVNKPKYILGHCSDISYQDIKDQLPGINNYHKNVRKFNKSSLGYNVGYHSFICNGKETICRVDEEYGNHCNQIVDDLSMNFQSLGVGMGFDGDVELPKPEDYKLFIARIAQWKVKWRIPDNRILFHRDFDHTKTCPGNLIDGPWRDQMIKDVYEYLRPEPPPVPVPEPAPPVEVVVPRAEEVVGKKERTSIYQHVVNQLKKMNDIEKLPWYTSSKGPEISLTLKAIAALVLPFIQDIFGFTIVSDRVDGIIQALVVLGIAGTALYGHYRAKTTLQGRIETLRGDNKHLRGIVGEKNVQLHELYGRLEGIQADQEAKKEPAEPTHE